MKFIRHDKSRYFTTQELTLTGILGGITMFLGVSGMGFLILPWMKATILQIPAIIAGIMVGPRSGFLVGLFFGMTSMYQNLVAPNPFSVFFLNPLLSVLPRVLIGPVAYYIYRAISKKSSVFGIASAAFAGSMVNTIGVLSMMYILYAKDYVAIRGGTVEGLVNVLLGIGIANGGVEAILSAVVITPLVVILQKALR